MKATKPIISAALMLVIISSSMGFAFATFSGYLTVEFDKTTANVGDTVTLTVTASNEGLDSWYPVEIYVPIPSGTQYVSHVVPDKTLQNYDPGSGIWNVNRMRHDERGHLKTLIITLKVLPEAAGEPITGTASFKTLRIEGTGDEITGIPSFRSGEFTVPDIAPVASFKASTRTGNAPLTVYFTDTSSNKPTRLDWDFGDGITDSNEQNPTHTYNNPGTYMVTLTASNSAGQSTKTIFINVNDPDQGYGGGTGGGNGNGTGLGNGSSSGLGSAAGLLNQQSGGGGGNGKAYEVFEDTPKSEIYYGLTIILIALIIVLGYLYGTKRKQ